MLTLAYLGSCSARAYVPARFQPMTLVYLLRFRMHQRYQHQLQLNTMDRPRGQPAPKRHISEIQMEERLKEEEAKKIDLKAAKN